MATPMENPKNTPQRLSVSVTVDDNMRLLQLRHVLELRDRRTYNLSEIVRVALKELEKQLAVAA